MQYQRLWRWWSLAEDVVLGEGAVTGPQPMLSIDSGCCWENLCSHSPVWLSTLELNTQNNLGWLGLLELLNFDGNCFKLKDVKIGGLSDARWIWENSWYFPEPPVCPASMQEDKAVMFYPVDCNAKAPKAELRLVAVSRSLSLWPPSFIYNKALHEQCGGTRVIISQNWSEGSSWIQFPLPHPTWMLVETLGGPELHWWPCV